MIRALAILFALVVAGCASHPPIHGDVIVESRSPIMVIGKWGVGRPICAVGIEHNGVTHVYWSAKGCGVVHAEVIPPHYEKYLDAWRP